MSILGNEVVRHLTTPITPHQLCEAIAAAGMDRSL